MRKLHETGLPLLALLLLAAPVVADVVRAATIRVAPIYLSPDTSSAKLADVDRGRELVFLETSGDWVKVEANLTEERIVTGWMQTKGLIQSKTPDGDKILFGEAVDSEDQASQHNGRRYAAQDAMRLYGEVAEIFPQSPLAAEGMYRSADIRWQIERVDVMSLPSAKEQEAYLRKGMNEDYFKKVMKKFPGTKWAYLAAYQMIDNKLCGDWQGQSKCPQKEAEIYENYAKQYPQSPAVAEALSMPHTDGPRSLRFTKPKIRKRNRMKPAATLSRMPRKPLTRQAPAIGVHVRGACCIWCSKRFRPTEMGGEY